MQIEVDTSALCYEDAATDAGTVATLPVIRRLVSDILAAGHHATCFADTDILAEIGIGSVDMVALLLGIESAFDVEVPQHEITPDVFRSVASIDAMMRRTLGAMQATGRWNASAG